VSLLPRARDDKVGGGHRDTRPWPSLYEYCRCHAGRRRQRTHFLAPASCLDLDRCLDHGLWWMLVIERPQFPFRHRPARTETARGPPAAGGMILMKTLLAAILTCLLTFASLPAGAVEPDEIMADQKLEARARALSAQLRCMVCQNESIDESGADLARDLRLLVRERLKAGDTDEQIRSFLVQRYGDFILLKPPVKPETWLLWSAPFLILLMGGVFIAIAGRRLSGQGAADCLTGTEQARLNAILEEDRE